uniref:Uncharacterized protein n=1 Tax=Parascaris equorum TaxID=6256 RepID=A0A914S2R5_PAREQ
MYRDLGESTRRSLTICRVDDEGSSRTITTKMFWLRLSDITITLPFERMESAFFIDHCAELCYHRISKGLPCHDMIIKSEEIANDFCELTKCIAETDAELQCEVRCLQCCVLKCTYRKPL